jgi:hypothetical protein
MAWINLRQSRPGRVPNRSKKSWCMHGRSGAYREGERTPVLVIDYVVRVRIMPEQIHPPEK